MYLNILFLQQTGINCTGCFWCWAGYMFLSTLLGLFIGKWIWGKYGRFIKLKDQQIKEQKEKHSQLEKDYINVKYQLDESEKDNKGLKISLNKMTTEIDLLSNQLIAYRKQKDTKIPTHSTIKEDKDPINKDAEVKQIAQGEISLKEQDKDLKKEDSIEKPEKDNQ